MPERRCGMCGEDIHGKKDSAKFCSDVCRVRHSRMHPARCAQCALPHFSVKESTDVCLVCHFADAVAQDMTQYKAVATWIYENGLCFYCGEYGNEKEHVVPRASHLPTWIVKACSECNLLASDVIFSSVEEKYKYIQRKRRKKYSSLLRMPDWTPDELQELGGALRSRIEGLMLAKDLVQHQLMWHPKYAFDSEQTP